LPRQGDLGGHAVLAFEDPSCSRCAAFHKGTVPQIKSSIVDPGLGAYVVRTYPVVYRWGKPATQALEATLPRSEDAFWSLLGQYFETQGQFNTGNVLDRTEAFLNESTDVDGSAVVEDAQNEAYNDAVQANIQAAENAGLGRTTPVVLLFRDGQFVTKANGSVSYDLIAETLGVSN
jgi:protein-disulfide isomerase